MKSKENNKEKKLKNKISIWSIIKMILFILLLALLFFLIHINYNTAERKQELENSILNIATLNENKIFTIDKIYLFSSASATNKEQKRALWDLDLYQYTDIAIYLNNHNKSGNTDENTLKELFIDNIKFNNLESGSPKLYYKNIAEFGKFDLKSKNEIQDKLFYKIITADPENEKEIVENQTQDATTSSKINYENPEIYTTCDNPITLEYVNSNIKEHCIISDTTTPLIYDGSLLKRCRIPLNTISCNLSFTIHIVNNKKDHYIADISFDIPLTDDSNTIFNGSMIKEITDKSITFIKEK